MGWADRAIKNLQNNKHTKVKPHGNSMKGKIESGTVVELEPIRPSDIKVGDVVLCKVKGNQYLHIVKAIDGERFLIGNSRGKINGWTRKIYGRALL